MEWNNPVLFQATSKTSIKTKIYCTFGNAVVDGGTDSENRIQGRAARSKS